MQAPDRADGSRSWRAVVADDDALARRTIIGVLRQAGIVVVAEATDGREAIELARFHEPDLVLMDIVMPELDGVAATRAILDERPDQLVILLTGAGSEELAVVALRVGAVGYLRKDVDVDALTRAIVGTLNGEAAISRTMTRVLIEQLRRLPAPGEHFRPVHSPLTTREWEVLDLVCEGKTTEEIAGVLVVSSETVRSHVKRILRKLGVRSRQEATVAAARMRGLDP